MRIQQVKARLKHQRLARELSKSRLSQNGWALRLGLDKGHLSKLVSGKRPYPNSETRRKLLEGLGVPFEALFEKHRATDPPPTVRRFSQLFRVERKSLTLPVPRIEAGIGGDRMIDFFQDIRFGVRNLARHPGFACLAILVLALGIGANAGAFSLIDALFLRPPDLDDPTRLARINGVSQGNAYDVVSYPNFLDLSQASESFSGMTAHAFAEAFLSFGDTGTISVQGELVSGNYFEVLGVRPGLGRTFLPWEDQTPGTHPVVVLGHGFWQRMTAGDPEAVGRPILINGHRFTVVGVAPPAFKGSFEGLVSDFWAPLMSYNEVRPRGLDIQRRGWGWLSMTARLKDGLTLAQANQELSALGLRFSEGLPPGNKLDFRAYPMGTLPESFRRIAALVGWIIAGSAGLMLLAACGNIAGMLLARSVVRRRELAVRRSLGAGRGRLLRQLLTESLLLSALSGAAGVLVALALQAGLPLLYPQQVSGFFDPQMRLDGRVLLALLAVTAFAAAAFGILPGLRVLRAHPVDSLREDGTSAGGTQHSRLFAGFVVTQVAICTLLLTASGLMLRTLQSSGAFDPGFDSERLLVCSLDLRRNGYQASQAQAFFGDLKQRLEAQPQIDSVAFTAVVPLGDEREVRGVVIPGHQTPVGRDTIPIAANLVSPGYFRTMGIPVLEGDGHPVPASLVPAATPVAVNRTMAQRFWGGDSPIGKRIRDGSTGPWLEIAAVVEDIKYYSLGEDPFPYFYALSESGFGISRTFQVRTSVHPSDVIPLVRREIEALDAALAPRQIMTMDDYRRLSLFPARAIAATTSVVGSLTLLLAVSGLLGLLSYSVGRRTREIGVRMALGAAPARVSRQVTLQGLRLTFVGIVLGLSGGWGVGQILSGFLFGVSAFDPTTFALVATVLAGATLVASYIPARSAARVDPIRALRTE